MTHFAPFVFAYGLVFAVSAWCAQAQSAELAKLKGDTPEARRTTLALNILESRGYCADLQQKSASAFVAFHAQDNDFVATVSQNGYSFNVTVNPETGSVARQN